jgi:hypothetical protein
VYTPKKEKYEITGYYFRLGTHLSQINVNTTFQSTFIMNGWHPLTGTTTNGIRNKRHVCVSALLLHTTGQH